MNVSDVWKLYSMITDCLVSSLLLKQISEITSLQREDVEIPLHSFEEWLTHALLALCSWFHGEAMHIARDTGWSKLLTPGQEGKKVEENGTGFCHPFKDTSSMLP